MPQRTRRHFSGEQKVAILRLHLLEGKPVSDICEEHAIVVNLFYSWQKQFFENGAAAFASKVGRPPPPIQRTPASRPSRRSSDARTRSSPNSWRSTSHEKKNLGNSERLLGSPRHARRHR